MSFNQTGHQKSTKDENGRPAASSHKLTAEDPPLTPRNSSMNKFDVNKLSKNPDFPSNYTDIRPQTPNTPILDLPTPTTPTLDISSPSLPSPRKPKKISRKNWDKLKIRTAKSVDSTLSCRNSDCSQDAANESPTNDKSVTEKPEAKTAPVDGSNGLRKDLMDIIEDFDPLMTKELSDFNFPKWDIEEESRSKTASKEVSEPAKKPPAIDTTRYTKTPTVVIREDLLSSKKVTTHELTPPRTDSLSKVGDSETDLKIDRNWVRYALSSGRPLSVAPFQAESLEKLPSAVDRIEELDLEKARYSFLQRHRPGKRTSLAILLIMLLALILIPLWLTGVIGNENGLQIPEADQTLAVDPNIANGPLGCSNYPMRAPLRASLYSSQMEGPGFLEVSSLNCPDGGVRYTLTECDLLRAMTTSDGNADISQPLDSKFGDDYLNQYVRRYLPHINAAIEIFDLNCSPHRLSAFLAQVRHETNHLKSMKQSIDGGAGSIHMIPFHFPRIVNQIKPIKQGFDREFGPSANGAIQTLETAAKKDKGSWNADEQNVMTRVMDLLASDEYTFMVGGWWFASGSSEVFSEKGCVDLRKDSDLGLGNKGSITGFYKISECIFGTLQDKGLSQRVDYFESIFSGARKYWKCQTVECLQ